MTCGAEAFDADNARAATIGRVPRRMRPDARPIPGGNTVYLRCHSRFCHHNGGKTILQSVASDVRAIGET